MYDFIIILLISYSVSQARDIPLLKQSLKQKSEKPSSRLVGKHHPRETQHENSILHAEKVPAFPCRHQRSSQCTPRAGQFQLSLSILPGSPVGPTVTPGQRSASFLKNLHPTSQLLHPSSQSSVSPHHNTTKITEFQDGLGWKEC